MREFTDSNKRLWKITVNGGTIKRVLDSPLKVDLGKPLEGSPPLMTRMDTDVVFLIDLLYVILQPQIEALELSEIEFAEGLAGEALKAAHDAWMEDWADFFRALGRTDLAQAIVEQVRMIDETMAKRTQSVTHVAHAVAMKLDEANVPEEIEKAIKRLRLGRPSASSPRSPDATPSPEPSAS